MGRASTRMPTPAADRTRTELVIDRIACDGFGLCAELLPELLELDDWGYPIVKSAAVPDALLDHAKRAVVLRELATDYALCCESSLRRSTSELDLAAWV